MNSVVQNALFVYIEAISVSKKLDFYKDMQRWTQDSFHYLI